MAKTKAFLRSKVWFPGMDGLVEKTVKDCASCLLLTSESHTMEPLKNVRITWQSMGELEYRFLWTVTQW
jgi:hypothetical protein